MLTVRKPVTSRRDTRNRRHGSLKVAFVWLILGLLSAGPSVAASVDANDNTRPSGRLEGDVLNVRLVAGIGDWRPEGPQGVIYEIAAFGEEGGQLAAPGPLIRAREGTTVVLTFRNTLGEALQVNGLCTKPDPCDAISIAPNTSEEIRFTLKVPGTYAYWGATGGRPLRGRRSRDTQLGGVIVVDPREGGGLR